MLSTHSPVAEGQPAVPEPPLLLFLFPSASSRTACWTQVCPSCCSPPALQQRQLQRQPLVFSCSLREARARRGQKQFPRPSPVSQGFGPPAGNLIEVSPQQFPGCSLSRRSPCSSGAAPRPGPAPQWPSPRPARPRRSPARARRSARCPPPPPSSVAPPPPARPRRHGWRCSRSPRCQESRRSRRPPLFPFPAAEGRGSSTAGWAPPCWRRGHVRRGSCDRARLKGAAPRPEGTVRGGTGAVPSCPLPVPSCPLPVPSCPLPVPIHTATCRARVDG